MNHLFDMLLEDGGWYGAVLESLIVMREINSLRLNAQYCEAEIIRQVCREALEQLGEPFEEAPMQLSLW